MATRNYKYLLPTGFVFVALCASNINGIDEGSVYEKPNTQSDRIATIEKLLAAQMTHTEEFIKEHNKHLASLIQVIERQNEKINQLENYCTDKEQGSKTKDANRNFSGDVYEKLFYRQDKNAESGKSEVKRLLLPSTGAPVAASPEIAFYSQKTTPVDHVGNYQSIIFDKVKVNHGGAYSGVDGEFLSPLAGIYVFSWTASNRDRTHMQTELVVNGNRYAHTWTDSGDHADYSVASVTCVAELKQGDRVWVRSGSVHSGTLTCDNNSMCSFTGFLLYQSENK